LNFDKNFSLSLIEFYVEIRTNMVWSCWEGDSFLYYKLDNPMKIKKLKYKKKYKARKMIKISIGFELILSINVN
jgi:hypothetical protein